LEKDAPDLRPVQPSEQAHLIAISEVGGRPTDERVTASVHEIESGVSRGTGSLLNEFPDIAEEISAVQVAIGIYGNAFRHA
jgi:hypothetical protein